LGVKKSLSSFNGSSISYFDLIKSDNGFIDSI